MKNTVEIVTMKAHQRAAGIRTSDLARRTGLSHPALRWHISRGVESPKVRALIENELSVPIWSDVRTFERRKHCVRVLGFDPYALARGDLRRRASRFNVGTIYTASVSELAERVLDHAAKEKFSQQSIVTSP